MDQNYLTFCVKNIVKNMGICIEEEQFNRILANSIFKEYKKGEILINIDEKTDSVGIVLAGMVRSYYIDSEGNDITRYFGQTGYICMDEGLFGYETSICAWEAIEDATIMRMNTKMIKQIIMSNEELKNYYIASLEKALQYKVYRENGFLVENATERYLHFRNMYPDICDRVKQSYIATYLGIAPETLSRIKAKL